MYRHRILFETPEETKMLLGRLPYGNIKVLFNKVADLLCVYVKEGKWSVIRGLIKGDLEFYIRKRVEEKENE